MVLAGVALLLLAALALQAHAAVVLTVNSTGDAPDAALGDGVCATATGECTLRAAIQEANALGGLDTITFNILPGGVQTITPGSQLPTITSPVVLDGTTQPGFAGTPIIEINGSGAGFFAMGLLVTAGGSTIRGLAVNRFVGANGFGIFLDGGVGNVIQGNYIGTDVTGTVDLGNSYDGVAMVNSSGNLIGGPLPSQRNVISGNNRYGVSIGNTGGNTVQGDFIGTNAAGTGALGNSSHGVWICCSAGNNTVTFNIIAYNGGDGVSMQYPNQGMTGNAVLANAIYSNGGLGIDLEDDGVTPNDPQDPDGGVNNHQNFPVLTSATSPLGGAPTIKASLNSTANTSFILKFFANTFCDPSGYGEGQTFIVSTNVVTDGVGDVAFSATLFVGTLLGAFVTATATDPSGNTSEFSQCIAVTPGPPYTLSALKTGLDTDSAAGVTPAILQVVDAISGQPVSGVLVGAYQANLAYPGGLVNVLEARLKPPFDGGAANINNPAGVTGLVAFNALGTPWPVDLAFLPLRLLGCSNQAATVTLTFVDVFDADANSLGSPPPVIRTYRKGDAKANGVISVADVLYIAQYLAGLRTLGDGPGQLNAVNAASVKQDGAFDTISSADVLYLAQYVVGMRDGCFNLLPSGAPPQR